jgi:hypothetical protein
VNAFTNARNMARITLSRRVGRTGKSQFIVLFPKLVGNDLRGDAILDS